MTQRLSITHVGGETLTFDVPDQGDLIGAVARQDPCYPLAMEDGRALYLNTRHIVAWTVEDAGEDVEPDAPPAEPADGTEADTPEEPAPEPAPAESAEDTRTVSELKAALDAASVEYDSKALKADLQELAKTNNV